MENGSSRLGDEMEGGGGMQQEQHTVKRGTSPPTPMKNMLLTLRRQRTPPRIKGALCEKELLPAVMLLVIHFIS